MSIIINKSSNDQSKNLLKKGVENYHNWFVGKLFQRLFIVLSATIISMMIAYVSYNVITYQININPTIYKLLLATISSLIFIFFENKKAFFNKRFVSQIKSLYDSLIKCEKKRDRVIYVAIIILFLSIVSLIVFYIFFRCIKSAITGNAVMVVDNTVFLIAVAILEEMIFRVFIPSIFNCLFMTIEFPFCLEYTVSAILFGLLHRNNGSVGAVFSCILLGLFLGILIAITKNVLFPIILHFIVDAYVSAESIGIRHIYDIVADINSKVNIDYCTIVLIIFCIIILLVIDGKTEIKPNNNGRGNV